MLSHRALYGARRRLTNWQETCFRKNFIKVCDTRRRVLEIKSLKQGVIQDKGVNMMRTVFRMDVSKASSEVAILVNGEKVHGYTMPNDAIGFSRLLEDLK